MLTVVSNIITSKNKKNNKNKKKNKNKRYKTTYKGESYSTNPWAVCHSRVDKKKNPDKFERCVKDVKSKSKI